MKKAGLIIVGLVALFILWPSPIDPAAWKPGTDPGFEGPFAVTADMDTAEVVPVPDSFGPETVAMDADGRIYGGLQDGTIVRFGEDRSIETFVTIDGGRPLGLTFDQSGNLIVADAWKGLLSVDKAGKISTLTTEADGIPFLFTDDLAIASDGRIYFSDASFKYGQDAFRLDLLEARGNGRLLRYDPADGSTETLLADLCFANGVALSENEDFVLVNETTKYRITRYWLTGDKAGTSDIFIDNLPGFPDGISSGSSGIFWVAMPSPRNPLLDRIHDKPFLKALNAKLPKFLQPQAIRRGTVMALDEAGKVIHHLSDDDGDPVHMITAAVQAEDKLLLGSLEAAQFVIIDLPR